MKAIEITPPPMSTEFAYFLGLFTADGTIEHKGYTVAISLKVSDSYILRSIAQWLRKFEFRPTLKHQKREVGSAQEPRLRLRVYSKRFVELLVDRFGFPSSDKTSHVAFPLELPDTFLPDFVRGLNDSDGGVYFYPHLYKFNVRIEGSERLLQTVAGHLSRLVGVKARAPHKHNTGNTYLLSYDNRYDSHKICEFIYRGPPTLMLKRKYMAWRSFVKSSGEPLNRISCWTQEETSALLKLKEDGSSLRSIATVLKRTESSVKNRLHFLRRAQHEVA